MLPIAYIGVANTSTVVTIRLIHRTDKANPKGLAPIQIVIQIKGDRKYFQVDEKILPANWENGELIYVDPATIGKKSGYDPALLLNKRAIKELRDKIGGLCSDVRKIYDRKDLNGETITAKDLVDELKEQKRPKTRRQAPTGQFIAFIDDYLEHHKHTRAAGSLQVYRSLRNHVEEFQQIAGFEITFDNCDQNTFQAFMNFLSNLKKVVDGKKVPQLNSISIAKQLATMKTLLKYAEDRGMEVNSKYRGFKVKRDEPGEVIALTMDEVNDLINLDLTAKPNLADVRNVFVFSCATGLRFSDLKQLKWSHIKATEILIDIHKTKERSKIPLNKISQSILNKYRDRERPLPVTSNQRSNQHIKTICKMAGITEKVERVRYYGIIRESKTFEKWELVGMHAGRKTFVTTCLQAGMREDVVKSLSGHKDSRSFRRYVRVTENDKRQAMELAWGKAENLKAV